MKLAKLSGSSVLFFCAILSAHGKGAQEYIVGGEEVNKDDPVASTTVALYQPSADARSGSLCSATLLKKDIAVTAAHCLQPGGGRPSVLFGPDLHAGSIERRPVEKIRVNPEWARQAGKGMDQGDIALVKFPGGLPAGFHQASVIKSDSEVAPGTPAVLAGYGISDAHTKTGAGRLRKATVRVLSSRPGKSEMILDQSHGRGACHGDSGGPAYIRKKGIAVLAGLTNRGYPNRAADDCAHQVVYTKLPAYKSWIAKSEKQMQNAHSSTGLAPSMPERPILMAKKMRHRLKKVAHNSAEHTAKYPAKYTAKRPTKFAAKHAAKSKVMREVKVHRRHSRKFAKL